MVKLQDEEYIIKVFRKHWFLPFIHTINVTILFLIPVIILLVIMNKDFNNELVQLSFSIEQPSMVTFLISLWGLILWLRFFSFWTDHHLDGWILTNKRIIDIEQHGFFKREIASFRLERLQDVTTSVKGLVATLLKFGEVHAQTAGADREFILKNAPNPKQIRQAILDQHDKTLEESELNNADGTGATR